MSARSPLVTVYIASYNYARFIEQAIDSVLDQTLRDFELIIIDDGSNDGSRKIIEKYADHEKIIAVYQRNQGLAVTNNIALRQARGQYVMRLDADDWLDEHALQVMSGVLDRHGDIGLVFPDYYHVDETGGLIEVVRRHDFDDVELMDQPAHGACTMIRRRCLTELGGYDESIQCQDGWDLWVRFIQHYGVKNVNLPLFYYRRHGASLTRDEKRLLETRQRILDKHAKAAGQALRGVGIIPVRGSRFDPGSVALRMLGDRTVLDWTVDAALGSRRLDTLIVSSPDEDLLNHVAERYGDTVLRVKRERDLAMPNTPIEDTLAHALSSVGERVTMADALAVLYIGSPFRSAEHIDSAFDVMELFDADSVTGVRPESDLFYRHDGSGLVPLRKTPRLRLEREELYRGAGRFHLVRREHFETHGEILGGKIGHVVMDEQGALSLRSEWDWAIAEALVAKRGFVAADIPSRVAE